MVNQYRIPVMRLEQGGYEFFVGAYSAKALLSVAFVQAREEGEGVQRILSAVRLKEIGRYLTSSRQPGLLPNSVILSLGETCRFDRRTSELVIPIRDRQAFVVDGQHRLFAFKDDYVGDFDMPVPFSAFLNLPLEEVAYLFRIINSTQRKINPSLVYDLIPYLRKRDWVSFEESRAQYLVETLNEEKDSPWYRHISMLGGRDQPITQASFVTAIRRLLKRGDVLSEEYRGDGPFFGQEIQYELLQSYFSSIRDEFQSEWLNDAFVVSKNLGVSAFLNVLREIVDRIAKRKQLFDGDALALVPKDFTPSIRRIKKGFTWRRTDMAKTYLGAAGIRTLTEEMSEHLT